MSASVIKTTRSFASLVKLSHSVFALPFALVALLVSTRKWPDWQLLLLVVGATRLAAQLRKRPASLHQQRRRAEGHPSRGGGKSCRSCHQTSPLFMSRSRRGRGRCTAQCVARRIGR